MRRLLVLSAAALAIAAARPASAQMLGVKLGGTFSTLNFSNTVGGDPDVKRLPAFGGGIFMPFGKGTIVLQPELMMLPKGARFRDPNDSSNDIKLKLNYIEVPVTVLLRSKVGVYVFGGPSVAFEGSCTSEVKEGFVTTTSRCNESNAPIPDRHKLDFNIHAGAGYRYQIGTRALLLEARQMWGLRNINSTANDPATIKNSSFAVLLGYSSAPPKRRGGR